MFRIWIIFYLKEQALARQRPWLRWPRCRNRVLKTCFDTENIISRVNV